MRARVEVDGLLSWQRDLERAQAELLPAAERVVSRGALNIKNGARRRLAGHPHLPHYPDSITYDLERRGTVVQAEVGPDKDRPQGALGNLIEYGNPNNPGIPAINPELDLEAPRFVNAVADLGERMLEQR
jgi:hypothetical protein